MVATEGDGEPASTPLDLFLSIGLDRRTAENTLVNAKVTSNLTAVITEAGVVNGCSKAVGNLLYMVSTKFPANTLVHRPALLDYIVSLKIKNSTQLDYALVFLAKVGPESFQLSEFEESCGVGLQAAAEHRGGVLHGGARDGTHHAQQHPR